MPISPEELVEGVTDLVSLPEVCFEVNAMTESTEYSASDIADVVSRDPALTAQVLRIANSAYYGFPAKVETVSRAVTVIGNRELRDLVLATSFVDSFAGMRHHIEGFQEFWRHSFQVGIVARSLVSRSRHRVLHSERLFVAGLLHDIGRLVMMIKIPELVKVMRHRAAEAGIPMAQAEREVFDMDHAQVGAALLKAWDLPESLQAVAAHHHHPQAAGDFRLEAGLVHLADSLARKARWAGADADNIAPVEVDAWAIAGLEEQGPDIIPRQAEQRYRAAWAAFAPQTGWA